MDLTPEQYGKMVKGACPPSALKRDCLWAFGVGGAICTLGEGLRQLYLALGWDQDAAGALTSITLIGLSGLFTCMGLYHKLAVRAGAGTLVPITGFANAVISAAIEFKAEGLITGVGAKMFVIAGPVIVYGLTASWVWGMIYWVTGLLGQGG